MQSLKPFLSPLFIYGLLVGCSSLLIILMRLRGFTYTLDTNQIHAYTLLWLCCLYGLVYSQFSQFKDMKRALMAFAATIFVFYIHDSLWIYGTFINGVQLEGTVLFNAPLTYYIGQFSRNFLFIFASWLVVRKQIHYKRFVLFFSITIAYWIYNIYGQNVYIFPIYPLVDSLPIIAFITWKSNWRKRG